MRSLFASHVFQLRKSHPNISLLMADIGNRMFDDFIFQFPESFLNCGIAEASMINIATGLALNSRLPFCYTITPFLILRALEQIKIGLAYHELPICLVGTGSGLSYGPLGPTHQSIEDISLIRSLPNISIYSPDSPAVLKCTLDNFVLSPSPTYIRIGKKGEPNFSPISTSPSHGSSLHSEGLILLVTTGPILSEALSLLTLFPRGSCTLISINALKPLDTYYLDQYLNNNTKYVITLEEHSVIGGLGSIVGEYILSSRFSPSLHKCGINDYYEHTLGSQGFLRDLHGLSTSKLYTLIGTLL